MHACTRAVCAVCPALRVLCVLCMRSCVFGSAASGSPMGDVRLERTPGCTRAVCAVHACVPDRYRAALSSPMESSASSARAPACPCAHVLCVLCVHIPIPFLHPSRFLGLSLPLCLSLSPLPLPLPPRHFPPRSLPFRVFPLPLTPPLLLSLSLLPLPPSTPAPSAHAVRSAPTAPRPTPCSLPPAWTRARRSRARCACRPEGVVWAKL
jgi:hypothetical protein